MEQPTEIPAEQPTEIPVEQPTEVPPVEQPTEAPLLPLEVTVRYLNEAGEPIAAETVCPVQPGSNTIYPMAVIPDEYELTDIGAKEVFVDAAGVNPPVVEFNYKNEELENPLINISHILAMKLATREEMDYITDVSLQINQLISAYMREVDIELIDFTLEFGRFKGSVLVADEISPDVARFWDAKTHEPLDIDRFRRDMGNAEQAYQELLHRMMGLE